MYTMIQAFVSNCRCGHHILGIRIVHTMAQVQQYTHWMNAVEQTPLGLFVHFQQMARNIK